MGATKLAIAVIGVLVAATPAFGQAGREVAETTAGQTRIAIEYGNPQWSEERRATIDRLLPVGAVWRIGSDDRTTMVVEGGDVMIGGVLVPAGGYGLNLRRIGAKEWEFVAYDGIGTTVVLDDNEWDLPATFAEKSDAAPPALSVAFAEAGGKKQLRLRWGPLEISAPVTVVTTSESELTFQGESATCSWYSCAAADVANGAWFRAGRIGSFYVGEVDCGMDVDLRVERAAGGAVDGGKALVRFTNREVAKRTARIARIDRELAQLATSTGPAGGGGRRQDGRREELDDMKTQLAAELVELAEAPPLLALEIPLARQPKASGRVSAMLVRQGDRLLVRVTTDDSSGEAAVDEKVLLPAKR